MKTSVSTYRGLFIRLIITLIVLLPICASAQLDTLHFIPPWHARSAAADIGKSLVVSTPSGTPVNFVVELGDGSILTSGTCSNSSDFTYALGGAGGNCGTNSDADLNTIHNTEGLIIRSEKPVWVNLSSPTNAFYSSLGAKLGLGTEFRIMAGRGTSAAVGLRYLMTYSVAIMASEDGTTVTFDDINTGVTFAGTAATAGTSDDITITLDKGESYIISAHGTVSAANRTLVSGLRVSSDKPITVASTALQGAGGAYWVDHFASEVMPVENLGSEYIVRGGGNAGWLNYVRVMAIEDGTEIYRNGSASPTWTLNAGQVVTSTAWSAGNQHFSSNKGFYCYEFTKPKTPAHAHDGHDMQLVPPLTCLGPRKTHIPLTMNAGIYQKVFITAPIGADVFINGGVDPLTGWSDVNGSDCYQTKVVFQNVTEIESDSSIFVSDQYFSGGAGGNSSATYINSYQHFLEIDRSDSLSFVLCQDTAQVHAVYSVKGDYLTSELSLINPENGGQLIFDETIEDTIRFTYVREFGFLGLDTAQLQMSKVLQCCGHEPDTLYYTSTFVFNNVGPELLNATVDDDTICIGDAVLFDHSGAETYEWSDGIIAGSSFTPDVLGTSTYTLTGYDIDGCVHRDTIQVHVHDLPNVIGSVDDDEICQTDEVIFTGTGATDYNWPMDIEDGVAYELSDVGTFEFIVEGTDDNGCVNYDTVEVLIHALPTVIPAVNDAEICIGDEVIFTVIGADIYEWDLGVIEEVTYEPATIGTTTYTVIGTDINGCKDTADIDVLVHELPTVEAHVSDDEICFTDAVIFTGDGAETYSWDNGVTEGESFEPTEVGTTTYTVTGTDANGCINTATIDVMVFALPVVIPTVDDNEICYGDPVVFNGTGAETYDWSLDIIDGLAYTPGKIGTTTYTVIGTDENGCLDTASIDVLVHGLPTVTTSNDTSIFIGESTLISAEGSANGTYSWSPLTALDCEHCDQTAVSPMTTITYTVLFTDENGCQATDEVLVKVNGLILEDKIGISPNGDGLNETLDFKGLLAYPNSSIHIFNRWGVEVYTAENGYQNDWRGTDQNTGDLLPNNSTCFFVLDLGEDGAELVKGYVYISY